MTDHDKLLIGELERRLLWYREEASEDEFDADEVDAICTMLLKLSPVKEPYRTKEETYQNIMRQISLEEERSEEEKAEETDGKKPDAGERAAAHSAEISAAHNGGKRRRFFAGKRGLRAAVILLAAAGALASLNMVSYARENKSLFTMILERVGVLKIVKDETAVVSSAESAKIGEEFYDSWAELDPAIKEKIAVPEYIPEGYSLYGIRCWDSNDRDILQANYYDRGSGHILFEITLWESNPDQYRENAMDERECALIPEYSDENTLYYTYRDEYICMAFMENSFYRISGNIALEEMVKIREGM